MAIIGPVPAPLDISGIPASNKMPAPGQINLINQIRKDAATYNMILPTAVGLNRLRPTEFVDQRVIALLDSIFTNAMAYMLLKPRASRGQKGQQRDAALRALIGQLESHAEYLGMKFLVSSFEKGQVNFWLERSDQRLYGKEVFDDFLAWVETTENQQFKDRHANEKSRLHYLREAERQQYMVQFEGHLIKDNDGQPITTLGTGGYSGLDNSAIYVCSARTRKVYSADCEVGRMHHSSFMAGEPVIAAGDWVIESGRLVFINTASGHYRPTVGNMTMFLQFYGGVLHPDAWIRPEFNGPVYRLRDYWLRGGGARPDPKWAKWLAERMSGPVDYDKANAMSPESSGPPEGTYINR